MGPFLHRRDIIKKSENAHKLHELLFDPGPPENLQVLGTSPLLCFQGLLTAPSPTHTPSSHQHSPLPYFVQVSVQIFLLNKSHSLTTQCQTAATCPLSHVFYLAAFLTA